MPKFFMDQENIKEDHILLPARDAKHMTILRYQTGDSVTVCDGQGRDYTCTIRRFMENGVVLDIDSQYASAAEPGVLVSLYQGIPKGDKMEWIIQKCVELGVYDITAVFTEHTVVRANEKTGKKTERWQKIAEEAAKQCGRGIIPKIYGPVSFSDGLSSMRKLDEAYVAYEKERGRSLKECFDRSTGGRVGFMIGPEGGFSEDEMVQCVNRGVIPVSLGNRILRTETAGFTVLTAFLYARSEL